MQKKIFLGIIIILTGLFLITFSVVKQSSKISITPTQLPLVEDRAIELPVSEFDPFYGNPGSPVTVDEFFSFDCKECNNLHKQLITYIDSNQEKVRLRATGILQTNWIGQQEDSLPLLALTCAEKQGNYWPFLNKILQLSKLNDTTLKSIVQELKLDTIDFDTCLKNETIITELQNKQAVLQNTGFSKTPLIFINNKKVNLTGDVKIEDILKNIITQ